jgi:protein Tex
VHPEAYPLVARISEVTKRSLRSLIGDGPFLKSLKPAAFADASFGIPTISDVLRELEKPGRDPRPQFKTANFAEGIERLADLQPGMQLEGVVTNVTAFGAFVDVGVHQDGLVHISELSQRFVRDPREVVKAGDVVKVRVRSVDLARKRIALTMKSGPIEPATGAGSGGTGGGSAAASRTPQPAAQEGALAAALRRAQKQN